MMLPILSRKRFAETAEPPDPYFLRAENLFAQKGDQEVFIKKIYSDAADVPARGSVILAPGIATNGNLFRMDPAGGVLALDHNRSLANLLASEGFDVYLYNPAYTERLHNRYVSRYCRHSIHYDKKYTTPPQLTFVDLVDQEVPLVIDFVARQARHQSLTWFGYSMGGMLIYSYLARHPNKALKNVITVGSPMSLTQILFRILPFSNTASKVLGYEETSFMGTVTENLVPLTGLVHILPSWLLRYNLLALLICNPSNLTGSILKTFLNRVVEPIPSTLQKCFAASPIPEGCSIRTDYASYLADLRRLRETGIRFLFFYGQNDILAPPDSVSLAHEIISPDDPDNIIEVLSAGHLDLIIGRDSMETVWLPALAWLKEQARETRQIKESN